MARTSKLAVKAMLKDAAIHLQCHPWEVFGRLQNIAKAFDPAFMAAGYTAVQISPYKDNMWTISALTSALDRDGEPIPGAAMWKCMPFSVADMVNDVETFVHDFCDLCA